MLTELDRWDEALAHAAEVEERARALCRQIAGYSPVAVQAVKASVRVALSSSLEAGLRYENEMNTLCFSAGDHMEGIEADDGLGGVVPDAALVGRAHVPGHGRRHRCRGRRRCVRGGRR